LTPFPFFSFFSSSKAHLLDDLKTQIARGLNDTLYEENHGKKYAAGEQKSSTFDELLGTFLTFVFGTIKIQIL